MGLLILGGLGALVIIVALVLVILTAATSNRGVPPSPYDRDGPDAL